MGIPLIALMGNSSTHPVQPDNLVEDAQRAQQIGAQRALLPGQVAEQGIQQQLGQQAIQSGALDLAQHKAVNDAWKAAFTAAPDGSMSLDPQKLTQALATSGAGSAIPAVQKGLLDMQENIQKVQQGKANLANFERDAAGAGAQSVLASVGPDGKIPDYSRAAFFQMMHNAGYDKEAQQLQQLIQQNPQQEMQIWKSLVAGSPKQQELATQAALAASKTSEAATAAQKEKFIEDQGGENVEAREMNDFLKNPPKGYQATPTDFMRYKATVTPLAQINVANSAGGGLQDEAINQAAQRYLTTGQLPPAARGVAGLAQNRAIMNRAAQLDPSGNITSNAAVYDANKKSLAKLQTNFDQVNAFENTAIKNLDQVAQAGAKIPDLGTRFANVPVRMISEEMIGTPEMAQFRTALLTAQTEAAKVLNSANANGVLSDSARHEAQEVLSGNLPFPAMMASINQLKTDFANRHQSYQEQIADIQRRLGNPSGASNQGQAQGGFKAPQGAPAAPQEDNHILKQNGKTIAVSKGGQWVAPPSQ